MNEKEQKQVMSVSDPRQIELFEEIVKLEHGRIDSQNRRSNVALRAIELADAADKRQFEYHSRRVESEEKLEKSRLRAGIWIISVIGVVIIVFLFLTLYMTFWGSESQVVLAQQLLNWAFILAAGGGSYMILRRLLRWVLGNS